MAEKKRAPAFQFYPNDFISDGRVDGMSNEELGAYMRLLCKAWFEVPTGSLPSDATTLARWARCSDREWRKVAPRVLACFLPAPDGRLYQKRMVAVAAEQDEYAARMAARAKKGAEGRWGKDMLNGCLADASSIPQAMPNLMLGDAPSPSPSSVKEKKGAFAPKTGRLQPVSEIVGTILPKANDV